MVSEPVAMPEEQLCVAITQATWDDAKHMDVRYIGGQLERAESTGRLHWQFYIEFSRQHRMSAMKLLMPSVHWEGRHGPRETAKAYSKKLETRVAGPCELGTWIKGQGARTDLREYAEAIRVKGMRAAVIERPWMYLRMTRGTHALQEFYGAMEGDRNVKIHLLWGEAGVGKTRAAFAWARRVEEPWRSPAPSAANWYAYGYCGQRIVILDDMSGSMMRPMALLALLDVYPYMVNASGRGVPWLPLWIIITSNFHYSDWYADTAMHQPALARRIHFTTRMIPGQWPILFGGAKPSPLPQVATTLLAPSTSSEVE